MKTVVIPWEVGDRVWAVVKSTRRVYDVEVAEIRFNPMKRLSDRFEDGIWYKLAEDGEEISHIWFAPEDLFAFQQDACLELQRRLNQKSS